MQLEASCSRIRPAPLKPVKVVRLPNRTSTCRIADFHEFLFQIQRALPWPLRCSQYIFNIRRVKIVIEQILYVTDDTFEAEVINSSNPVLVDYWAEWCGPCKMIAPILEEIAGEYTGKVTIAKLNIDENPQTPPKYGIRGIPTLMLFKDGNVEATKVGALSKSQLTAFLDSNI
jgi:thioredoxin 1